MPGRTGLRRIGAWLAIAVAVGVGFYALHERVGGRRDTAEVGSPAATTIIIRVIGPALL